MTSYLRLVAKSIAASATQPVIEGSSTYTQSGTFLATHPIPYPASVAADELLLCILANDRASPRTTPSGFTEIHAADLTSAQNTQCHIFAKKATGSESGTVDVDQTNSEFGNSAAGVLRISGLPSGWVVGDIGVGTPASAGATSVALNGVTPTGDAPLILRCLMGREYTPGWPSGMTQELRNVQGVNAQVEIRSDDDDSTEGSLTITGGTTNDASSTVTLAVPGG